MSYATQDQIQMAAGGEKELLGLADWDDDNAVDAAVIAEAQARADALVDSYLNLRYLTPLANPSDAIVRLSADESVFWMRSARPQGVTPEQIADHKARLDMLAQYRDGKLRPDDPPPAPSSAIRSVFIPDDHPLSRKNSRGMW